PLPAIAQPSDRDRRRARASPAERRHRARPSGGLRLRRDQRDRPGRADRRADRPDHRRRARSSPRPPGRGLLPVALTLPPDAVPADASPSGPGATAAGWRAVEVAVDAAGRGGDRTYTYLVPDALADLEPGEAVLVEFGRRQALGI